MNNEIKVSIIIVNYNTLELTLNCINSIYNKTIGVSFEIILIDNASTDGSKKVFEMDRRIKYIYSYENLGFGGGNNLGAQSAKGKYLFFLNPDTTLINNAIHVLVDFMESNPVACACGGNLYDANGNPAHSFRRYLPGLRWELNLLFNGLLDKIFYGNNTTFNHTDHIMKVGYITGADLMISKSIFLKNHGFSRDFFMYYEETDLCYRVTSNNKNIYSVPMAKIIHLEGKSFSSERKKHRRITIEKGYKIYRSKNYTWIQIIIGVPIHGLYLIAKKVCYSLLNK